MRAAGTLVRCAPLIGALVLVSALGLVRTAPVMAEEPAEVGVSDGGIIAAPPAPEPARPVVKRPGIVAPARTVVRADALDFRAPRPVAPRGAPSVAVKAEPATMSSAPPTPDGGLVSPAPTPSLAGVGLKLLLGSLALAALLYGAARWLKRMPFAKFLPGADGPIKVIGRTHLGPKASLCLVEVGSTTLLVSMTGTAIQALHVWPEGVTAAPGAERQGVKAPTASAQVPGQLRHLESRVTGRNV